MELTELVSFSGLKGSPLLGLSQAHRDESVICTSSNGGISVYDVSTQQAVLSWIILSPESITVPASYVPSSGVYVAVKNDNELVYWKPHVKFTGDFNVLKLPHAVHSLLTTPTSSSVVVVYRDTSIELLNYTNEAYTINQSRRKKRARSIKYIVCDCTSLMYNATWYMIMVYKVGVVYNIILYTPSHDNSTVKELTTSTIDAESVGELISLNSSSTTLYLTWSKGCVHTVPIFELINNLQFIHQPRPALGCPAGITCNNDKFIVLLLDSQLSVYDTKYHMLHSSIQISEPIDMISKCCHGYIFLFSSLGELFGCSFTVTDSSPSLALALGKGASSHGPKLFADAITDSKPSRSLSSKIDSFLSPSTSSSEKLKICKSLLGKYFSSSAPVPSSLSSVIPSLTNFLLGVSDSSYSSGPFHRNELLSLVTSGSYPVGMSRVLYMKALQCSDWPLIAVCLEYVQCLPEDVLVSMIESIIKLPSDLSFSVSDHKPSEIMLRDQLLWKVLSLPRNDVQLLKPLIDMSQTSVLAFFHLLCEYIKSCYVTTATANEWSQFEDAITWFGLILDSHFTRLILVPSMQSRILEVRDCINNQMLIMSNLSILACTQDIVKLSCKQTSNTNWLYKVEHVEL